ncbi:MAG: glycosyltransferase family 2 protein [Gemmobacter sp.]
MTGASVLSVILNWRTPEMTLRAAAAARVAMAGIPGAITLVDNDSQDGSFEAMTAAVAGWPPIGSGGETPVRVIQSGRNGGFGAGNNAGIRAGLPGGVRPDLVYILNSDAFPAPDAIRALRAHLAAHPATGFAGSHIHGPGGDPHQTAFRFPSVAGEFEGAVRFGPFTRLLRRHVVAPPLPTATGRVDWLAGASLMMRMDVLDRIGPFDEGFFLYFEETELCHRAARAGWSTDYVVESRVAHIGSVSTGMKAWRRVPGYWFDSRERYFVTVHGRGIWVLATLAHLAGGVLYRLRMLVQGKPRQDPPHFLRDLAAHGLHAIFRPRGHAMRAGEQPAE